jgi:hypothetical protein
MDCQDGFFGWVVFAQMYNSDTVLSNISPLFYVTRAPDELEDTRTFRGDVSVIFGIQSDSVWRGRSIVLDSRPDRARHEYRT